MNVADDVTLWLGMLFVAGVFAHVVVHQLAPEFRRTRRRRRNYGKVIAKAHRPVVMLSVDTSGK